MHDKSQSSIHRYQTDFYLGLFYGIVGLFGTSCNYVTAKYGLVGFDPITFSLIWLIAATFYGFFIVVFRGRVKELRLNPELYRSVIPIGVVAGFSMNFTWAGLQLLDPSFAAFLWRLSPALTILIGVLLLKEKFTFKEIFPIVFMIVGGCISTLGRWHIIGTGVLLTLLACFFVSIQLFLVKIKIKKISPSVISFYRNLFGTIVVAIWALSSGKLNFNVDLNYWYVTLFGAFLGPCMGILYTFKSYQYWDLSKTGVLRLTQPIIVLPMAFLFLGTFPERREFIGGMIILLGAFWFTLLNNQKSKNEDL